MTEREKVINGLQEAVDWLSTETSLTVVDQWVVRDALALLKAQEPIAPNHVEDGNYETSGIMNYWFMCGKCGSCVDPGDKYCRECGQAVKWE